VIEEALVFALGALASGLLALVLFPAFTRRAARLARRDAEARLPRSLAEIAAGKDAVRAEYAVKTARVEADLRQVRKALIEERLARAEEQTDLYALRSEKRAFAAAIEDAERRVDEARAELRAREEALNRAAAERRELERRLVAEADRGREAEDRAEEAARIATEIRVALVAAEARAAALADALQAVQADQEAMDARYAEAEDLVGRRTAELAAATEGHGSRAALEGAVEDLLAERKRLISEAAMLRRERDRARAAMAAQAGPQTLAAVAPEMTAVAPEPEPVVPLPPRSAPAKGRKAVRPPAAAKTAGVLPPAGASNVEAPRSEPMLLPPEPSPTLPASSPPADRPPVVTLDAEPVAASFNFPPLSAPAVVSDDAAVDPAEQARRVDDLARRLKQLRVRNASARSRHEAKPEDASEAPAAALDAAKSGE
jgi:hypothetical protein